MRLMNAGFEKQGHTSDIGLNGLCNWKWIKLSVLYIYFRYIIDINQVSRYIVRLYWNNFLLLSFFLFFNLIFINTWI